MKEKISTNPHRAIFWDRDGTLMAEVEYCGDPALVRAIPGVAEALADLRSAGWLHVIITNQSGIGRGFFTVEEYQAVNAALFRQLDFTFDGVYFCPELPEGASHRRKPGTEMIEEACADLGIDPVRSWFVGDRCSDISCGRAAGCRTILVRTGYGAGVGDCGADCILDSAAAVPLALR